MSAKSKSSSRKKGLEQSLDRPFDRDLLRRAREVAVRYRVILEPDEELGFIGNALEMPYVWADGRTPDACVRETRDALVSAIATMLEKGEVPPLGGGEEQRSEQVNVRLTPTEKRVLEEAARRQGFRGISDFVRSTTLSTLRSA